MSRIRPVLSTTSHLNKALNSFCWFGVNSQSNKTTSISFASEISTNSFIEPLPIKVLGSIFSTLLVWIIVGLDPAVFTKLTSSLRDSSLSALISFFKTIPINNAF